mgnify:CR=1 FL=1
MGETLAGSITRYMLGKRGVAGYLDDAMLIIAFMQCAYMDPYELRRGLNAVRGWINEMVVQDYMPQIQEWCTKQQSRTSRDKRLPAGDYLLLLAKREVGGRSVGIRVLLYLLQISFKWLAMTNSST